MAGSIGDRISIDSTRLREELLPRLVGTVFHVTSERALTGILKSRQVTSNRDGRFGATALNSENSYGRKRGYVCLFDLRSVTGPHLDLALEKLYFLDPWSFTRTNPAFLILSASTHSKLILGAAAQGSGDQWIPHVECWYPHDLALEEIEQVIAVDVARGPEDPFIEAHRRLHTLRGEESNT